MSNKVTSIKQGKETGPIDLDFWQLSSSAFIGIAAVAIIEMLGLQSLSRALTVSLICFSFSIPASAFIILHCRMIVSSGYKFVQDSAWVISVVGLNFLVTISGIVGLLWHLNRLAGTLFILVAFALLILFVVQVVVNSKVNEAELKKRNEVI